MRIFSDEKLCGADLVPKNDLKVLMQAATKSMIFSKSFVLDERSQRNFSDEKPFGFIRLLI